MPLKEKTIHLRWNAVAHTVLASKILGVSVADAHLRGVLPVNKFTLLQSMTNYGPDNDEEKMT